MTTTVDRIVGRCIGGDFDIERLIAAGGVGSVYEAVQRSTGKSRAVKVMHAWLLSDEKMRSRFVDEARLAGSIESDHVVEVVSAGIDAELGVPWIAMELLRGQTLAEYGERIGPMPRAHCLEVLTQARHGLQMAHSRSLVHRDLKPDNLFVADPRRLGVPFTIKVLDFGIAKWVQDVREGDRNSQAIGTPSWMAPEQLSNASSITPATDVWALGLLAFWMLTGREYWLAANDERSTVSAVLVELLAGSRAHASERAAELGVPVELPPGFDPWFARCLDVDPQRRFADAAACIDGLASILRDEDAGRAARTAAELEAASKAALPNTRDLDAAFDVLARPEGRAARAHAETAAVDAAAASSLATPRGASRPTARRLEAKEIMGALWAGSEASRGFFPLTELLAAGLPVEAVRRAGRQTTGGLAVAPRSSDARPLPDLVQEAVRRVCLILGVHPPVSLVRVDEPLGHFVLESTSPPTLGVPAALIEERSLERLRAHAAVGVACTLPAFAVRGLLDSAEALESARKAAVALARGAVTSIPYYRPLVSHLGPRRSELGGACRHAEPVDAAEFWRGVELTIARLALLCSADLEATLEAAAAVPFSTPEPTLTEELEGFMRSPDFEGYWHRSSG